MILSLLLFAHFISAWSVCSYSFPLSVPQCFFYVPTLTDKVFIYYFSPSFPIHNVFLCICSCKSLRIRWLTLQFTLSSLWTPHFSAPAKVCYCGWQITAVKVCGQKARTTFQVAAQEPPACWITQGCRCWLKHPFFLQSLTPPPPPNKCWVEQVACINWHDKQHSTTPTTKHTHDVKTESAIALKIRNINQVKSHFIMTLGEEKIK